MTILRFSRKAAEFWTELGQKTGHPVHCGCDLCLFVIQPKKLRYSRRTFFTAWLVDKIKLDYLIRNKKARKTKDGWRASIVDYNAAPFKKKLKEILSDVFDITRDDNLIDLGGARQDLFSYIKRSSALKFIRLKDDLFFRRWSSKENSRWKTWTKNRQDMRLCQRAVDFIRSRPGQQATKRELERHFSNKRKADLERAFEWLWFYPNLKQQKKGKSLIYYWQRP